MPGPGPDLCVLLLRLGSLPDAAHPTPSLDSDAGLVLKDRSCPLQAAYTAAPGAGPADQLAGARQWSGQAEH